MSYTFDDETYRPDAVIDLPGNTKIIIDAKTNTRNWMRAFQTEDLEIKENLISEAIENVKNTALNLSFKPYDQLDHIVVPNLIIMYMPLDTMYLELLKREGQDYLNDAYTGLKKRGTARRGTPILFTTPSLIGGLLRIIIWMWRERNARDDTSRMVLKMRDFRDNIRTFLKNFEDGAKSQKKPERFFRECVIWQYERIQLLYMIMSREEDRQENFTSNHRRYTRTDPYSS